MEEAKTKLNAKESEKAIKALSVDTCNKCKSCNYFERLFSKSKKGLCSNVELKNKVYANMGIDFVNENFGCIFHEPK